MNDLEICKRIAEIEGHNIALDRCLGVHILSVGTGGYTKRYNPLIDDALITGLIKKYIQSYRCDVFINAEEKTPMYYFRAFYGKEQRGIDYNKTACLAIIEANS